MLGSHDSMTFLPARHRVFELFSFLWRTQTKDLRQQAAAGVAYFDIRVRRTKSGWRLCHGLVDMNREFVRLDVLLEWVSCMGYNPNLRGEPYIRLILERGDSCRFEQLASRLAAQFPNVSFIGIKKEWKVLLNRDPVIVDKTFTPWLSGLTVWENVRRWWGMVCSGEPLTIKGHARRINPQADFATDGEGEASGSCRATDGGAEADGSCRTTDGEAVIFLDMV